MKWFVVFVAVAISIGIADEISEKRGVLTRRTRQALGEMGGVFMVESEKGIIFNCQINGLSKDGTQHLQATFAELKRCLGNSRMLVTTKNDYIQNMVDCSKDAVSEVRDCLPDNQKYFPDFLLDLAKSLVSFMYDEMPILNALDLRLCMNKFITSDVQMSYFYCMNTVAEQTDDTVYIPNSKKEFCDKFLPATECFSQTANKYCEYTENVNIFFKHYARAVEKPCETKEA